VRIPDITKEYRWFNSVLGALLLFAIIAPMTIDLSTNAAHFGPIRLKLGQCFVMKQFGHPCNTCGLTRSVVALYHWDWQLSQAYHPKGYLFSSYLLLELALRFPMSRVSSVWAAWLDLVQLVAIGVSIGVALMS